MILDDVIRAAVRDVMAEVLLPIIETDAFQARLAAVIAERSAAHPIQPCPPEGAEASAAPMEAEEESPAPEGEAEDGPNPAWFPGSGPGRRLTKEGMAELRAMAKRRIPVKRIARMLGMSEPAARRQVKNLAGAANASSTPDQPVVNPKMAAPDAHTVVVVPAAVVPAPSQPAAPSLAFGQAGSAKAALLRRDPETGNTIATPAAPIDAGQLEPVPASYEDALDWLFAELRRQKMPAAEIETRLAQLSTKQVLATCNAQRVKAGLSPYVLT